MLNIPDFIDSKFRFTIMVAKRAKQLIKGAPKFIDKTAENPITIAIDEVSSGKITYDIINSSGVYFGESDISQDSPADEENDIETPDENESIKEEVPEKDESHGDNPTKKE